MAENLGMPDRYGLSLTPTLHRRTERRTDPSNNQLPPGFVAVITGAGQGITMALSFAKAQASGISISSLTQPELDKLADELREINPKLKVLAMYSS
ncbi:hypothetical protein BT63DRAFT_428938 [Microthyrium microscopicum]|uniref:NAD(P)-binding protein n=1 Tax=Microthyrium microscopicum TaxID=703497 RepID=A0A6A6TYT7_9PEZI|nr:hypothetical protein BT63DRAFT_428938 [Microthyrium microscopicum]